MPKRGQEIIEYVVVFSVIIAVLLIMGRYVRSGLAGKFREAADSFGQGQVYAP
ncbi:MAG: hypothetical protein PHF11_02170 [Candidatus Omnitrophica bacterium]|nr:hypothetical protein [Candidatus Omnitrophota bacterium]